jgi:hypothetical protein
MFLATDAFALRTTPSTQIEDEDVPAFTMPMFALGHSCD